MSEDNDKAAAPAVPLDVLSVLGHELRGHVGVTRGYLRLLAQNGDLDERQVRAVAEASRAADRLAEVLDDLTEYGRWRRGDAWCPRARLPLLPLLRDATGELACADRAIPETLTVDGHAPSLQRVFRHLAEAAARALRDAERLAIAAGPADDAHAVRVTLAAAGQGWRLADLTEHPPDLRRAGLGLRLTVAEAIVSAHGGRLTEARRAGRWAGFVVRL